MNYRIHKNKVRQTAALYRNGYIFILVHFYLIGSSYGIHLSKTISFTALDLAKSAGMDDEDISAAAVFAENGSGGSEEGEIEIDGGGGVQQMLQFEKSLPHITEIRKATKAPVLPLCCTMETDDVVYYQCGGEVITSTENLNNNNGFQKKNWAAPYNLVSSKVPMEFRLERSVLACRSATFSATISLDINSTEGHHFYPDGSLKFENEFYRIDEYCISSFRKDKMHLQVCNMDCAGTSGNFCVHKCCELNEIYSFGSDDYPTGCQPIDRGGSNSASVAVSDIKWSPIFYHNLSSKLVSQEMAKLTPHYVQRYPSSFKQKCKSKKTTVFPFGTTVADYLTTVTGKTFKSLQFRLRKDGWLLYPFRDSRDNEIPVINRIQNYCIDGAMNYGETEMYTNKESQMVLFLCSGGVDEAFENSIIVPESDEVTAASNAENNTYASGGPSINFSSPSPLLSPNESNSTDLPLNSNTSDTPTSAEIYLNSKAKPHILYQLFQLNSHSRPANIVQNHNAKKLTKVKKRRPIMTLFPSHPNRTRIVTRKRIKKPKFKLPMCCTFPHDVNDGSTHHCRNRMIDFSTKLEKRFKNSNITVNPIWKVPGHFMVNGQDTIFALETNVITCGFGRWQLQTFIHNFQQNNLTQSKGPRESGILSDGYLKYENEFYRPEEFCINGLSPRIMEVLICKPNCKSKETPCIPKCCSMDEAYSLGLETGFRGCAPLSEEDPKFHPTFFRNMHYPLSAEDQEKIQPHFIQRYPPSFQKLCYRRITLAFPFSEDIAAMLNPTDFMEKGPTFKNLQFRFRSDSKLMYSVPDDDGDSLTAIYDRTEYCVDMISDYGNEGPVLNHENLTILFICASQPNPQEDENYR